MSLFHLVVLFTSCVTSLVFGLYEDINNRLLEGHNYFFAQNYEMARENYQSVIGNLHDLNLHDPDKHLDALCGLLFCCELLNEDEFAKRVFIELSFYVSQYADELNQISWIRNSPINRGSFLLCNHSELPTTFVDLPEMTPEEFCQFQCNGYAVAVASACSRVPNAAVQAVCIGCIFGLQQLCVRCCKGQGFWENCVRNLRRLFHDPSNPNNPAPHPFE